MSLRHSVLFFVGLILPVYCRYPVYNQIEGEKCKIDSNSNGICRTVNDCQIARSLLEIFHSHNLRRCGFKDRLEIVCCPEKNAPQSIETVRRSQQACQNYAKEAPLIINPFIADGFDALEGEFPHMAAIGYEDNGIISYNCGGTLISSRYILTAGHCTINNSGIPPSTVKLGSIYIRQSGSGKLGEDYLIETIIKHPDYRIPLKYNDLALLRLRREVKFTKFIQPACLHSTDEVHDTAIATGWGIRNARELENYSILQKVSLQIIDINECNNAYIPFKDERTLPEGIQSSSMICAGSIAKKGDSCNGDSGGPLQIDAPNNILWSVIGVTSFGTSCGGNNIPGVYNKISAYINWIEDIVWPINEFK